MGDEHTCASRNLNNHKSLKAGMQPLECWGSNEFGQTTIPLKLQNLNLKSYNNNNDIQISAGGTHSCALNGVSESSVLDCWGSDSHGQVKMEMWYKFNVSQVSAGATHTCIIWHQEIGHTVRCWGEG